MLLLTFLMLASSQNDTMIVQRQVDELVKRCDASKDIRFVAHGGNEVEIQFLSRSAELSAGEEQRLTCVFNGLKAMPELNLCFIGNALPSDS